MLGERNGATFKRTEGKLMIMMPRFLFGMIAICFAFAVSMVSVSAATVTVGIAWTGDDGYSLAGEFSFDNATSGPIVDETELISFEIEGFDSGGSLGSFVGGPTNFNFDVVTGLFLVGGTLDSATGQDWNATGGTGIGFASDFGLGTVIQCLYLDGACLTDSVVFTSTLVATPLPAALPLFLSVLAGIGLLRWRRRKAAKHGILVER